MLLQGSRQTEHFDIFSDWDYRIEQSEDFEILSKNLDSSICWRIYNRPDIWLMTLIDRNGEMIDYSGNTGIFDELWQDFAARETSVKFHDYWLFSFKHLKAIYRGYTSLVQTGIEYSAHLLREIYFKERFQSELPTDFYTFKQLHKRISPSTREIEQITGMPYASAPEQILKIQAMNNLMARLTPDQSQHALFTFEKRLQLLKIDKM